VTHPGFDRLTLVLAIVAVLASAGGCSSRRTRQAEGDCPRDTPGVTAKAGVPADKPPPAAASRSLENEYPDFRGLRRAAPDGADDSTDHSARSNRRHVPGRSKVSDQRQITQATPRETDRDVEESAPAQSLPIDRPRFAGTTQTASSNISPAMSGRKRMPEAATDNAPSQPKPIIDPPVLSTPPIDGESAGRTELHETLVIPRIQICRQVRGFDDVVPLDARRLRRGQPILIYATLENVRSVRTSTGYRTLTLSTLEVRTSEGELLERQPLGTAVDLVDVPRVHFFLTHLVTIPEELPPGDYTFGLCVDDLLGHGSAHARISVRVTEDRSPRDGTADTSRSATRPAGFQK
jgi:hypothetical protein